MSEPHFIGDASTLPDHGFGPRSTTWWGVSGFMAIEGTGFALAFAAYFFLMAQERQWPASAPAPDLLWSSVTLILLLVSELPNIWVKRAAEREDLKAACRGLTVMSLIVLALVISRRGSPHGRPDVFAVVGALDPAFLHVFQNLA